MLTWNVCIGLDTRLPTVVIELDLNWIVVIGNAKLHIKFVEIKVYTKTLMKNNVIRKQF